MQRRKRPSSNGHSANAAAGAAEDRWFRAVANYTYDWESWHGPDGRLIWVNPAVERIMGYSAAECLAMRDYPLPMIAEEDRDCIAEVLAKAPGEAGENIEFRGLHRNGQSRWLSLSWQPMYEDEGSYLGLRTSIRDVTDRHKLREQLRLHAEHLEQLVQERTARLRQLEQRQRQMEKLAALGQLAAAVAHEINNPLAGIRNAFELFKSGMSPDDEHFELLELIDREIERISGIILQMYQLYRRSPQRSTEFSLDRVVGEVVYLLESTARKHNVRIDWTPTDAGVRVQLPEGEVKQVLYNLIRNAIQASPESESVSVRLAHGESEAAVTVEDLGPGIAKHVAAKMFDPFFTTRQGSADPGMGLGLPVSRSLIEAMGGRIEVARREGGGTRFTAVLPLHSEDAEVDHE